MGQRSYQVGSVVQIPVWLGVEEDHRPFVAYVLRTLLRPLGLEPAEVFDAGQAHLSYGRDDSAAVPVRMAYSHAAHEMFASGGVYDDTPVWREWEGNRWPVFFCDESGSYDLVASAFLLLSSWQETTTVARDVNGRFQYEGSLQARYGFADLPVVDAYREWLATDLERAGVEIRRRSWRGSRWAFCPTVDVDYIRKWRKGMVFREVVHHLLLNRRARDLKARVQRFGRFAVDFVRPGDVYRLSLERIVDRVAEAGGSATLFLKAGAHGPYDVAYSLNDRWLQRVLREATRHGFEIGLHPSYHADTHAGYFGAELDRLASMAQRRPDTVRQHYLRYQHPTTLRLHEEHGVRIDSTLGFALQEGFRNGTCTPFRLFDLERRRETDVWEMPLAVMDGTLFNRRHLTVDEAVEATARILARCERFGGCAVILWHNTLYDKMDAPGWDEHFERTLAGAVGNGARVSALGPGLQAWLDDTL